MVIQRDGDYFYTDDLIASPSNHEEFSDATIHDYVYGGKKAGSLSKTNACWIKTEGNVISGTKAFYIDTTQLGRDNVVKYVKFDPWASKDKKDVISGEKVKSDPRIECEVIHAQTPTGKVTSPKGSKAIFVPKTYATIRLGEKLTGNTHLRTAQEVLDYAQRKVNETGGRTVKVASTGFGEYSIDGKYAGNLREASVKLAEDFHISMDASFNTLKSLTHSGDYEKLYVLPHEKRASIFDIGSEGGQMSPEAIQEHYQQAQMPQQDPNTALMQVGQQTQDPSLYDVGVLNSLSNQQDVRDMLAVYSPTLEKSLDNIGRMLLTFWIKGSEAKGNLGEETYHSTEEQLRTVFKELGNLVMKLNKRAEAAQME
jgi:hypothetical protein